MARDEAARYCETGDLLYGNVPLSPGQTPVNYIDNACDEIDSYLGGLYATPIIIPAPDSEHDYTVSKLVLKRISSQLATGRILTSISAGAEESATHSYGKYLIEQSLEAVRMLATGNPTLVGAPVVPGREEGNDALLRGAVYNVDPYSQVEGFGALTMPGGLMNTNPPAPVVYPTGVF